MASFPLPLLLHLLPYPRATSLFQSFTARLSHVLIYLASKLDLIVDGVLEFDTGPLHVPRLRFALVVETVVEELILDHECALPLPQTLHHFLHVSLHYLVVHPRLVKQPHLGKHFGPARIAQYLVGQVLSARLVGARLEYAREQTGHWVLLAHRLVLESHQHCHALLLLHSVQQIVSLLEVHRLLEVFLGLPLRIHHHKGETNYQSDQKEGQTTVFQLRHMKDLVLLVLLVGN